MIDEEDEEAFTSSAVMNMECMFLKTWLHDKPCHGAHLLRSQLRSNVLLHLYTVGGSSDRYHRIFKKWQSSSPLQRGADAPRCKHEDVVARYISRYGRTLLFHKLALTTQKTFGAIIADVLTMTRCTSKVQRDAQQMDQPLFPMVSIWPFVIQICCTIYPQRL